jgi:hypothetical protein
MGLARFFNMISGYYANHGRFRPLKLSAFADESCPMMKHPRNEMFYICSKFFLMPLIRDMPSTHMLKDRSRRHASLCP